MLQPGWRCMYRFVEDHLQWFCSSTAASGPWHHMHHTLTGMLGIGVVGGVSHGSLWTSCGASWLSGSVHDVQARDRGFNPRLLRICSDVVLLGKALCSHVHSLDPGVSGYLVGQWRLVCLNSSMRWKMAAGLYAPQGVEMAYERAGPMTRGVIVWSWASGTSR